MIVFYEDEPFWLEDYFDILKSNGIEYLIFDNAEKLLDWAVENYDMIQLFVIDIMVYGEGNEFKGKNVDGMICGLLLLEELDKRFGDRKEINKIIFTNRGEQTIQEIENDERIHRALQKIEVLPSEFLKIVKEAIKN